MPSSYSLRFRLNYQAPGDNLNTWGLTLNNSVFQLLEDAMARRVAFALSGPKTLTTANGADDEARCAFLDVTSGSGGAITIPAVEKLYVVRNGASADVTVTTGGGTSATVKPGEVGWVVCDAANVRRVQLTDLQGARLTGIGSPLNGTDAATKSYADALAFNSVNLPGQGPGTVGKYVQSDGTNASWAAIQVSEVAGAAPIANPTFTGTVEAPGGADVAGLHTSGGSTSDVTAVAAFDLNFSLNDFQTKSISANTAFTISGLQAGKVQLLVLVLTITSNAVPSFPAWVDFENGVDFLSTLGNGTHWLTIATINGGTSGVIKLFARNVG